VFNARFLTFIGGNDNSDDSIVSCVYVAMSLCCCSWQTSKFISHVINQICMPLYVSDVAIMSLFVNAGKDVHDSAVANS